jgi:hypothetical protein
MEKKIEIYSVESASSKLTVTPDRVTVKVGTTHTGVDFSKFAEACGSNINPDQAYRGRIIIVTVEEIVDSVSTMKDVIKCYLRTESKKFRKMVSFYPDGELIIQHSTK